MVQELPGGGVHNVDVDLATGSLIGSDPGAGSLHEQICSHLLSYLEECEQDQQHSVGDSPAPQRECEVHVHPSSGSQA